MNRNDLFFQSLVFFVNYHGQIFKGVLFYKHESENICFWNISVLKFFNFEIEKQYIVSFEFYIIFLKEYLIFDINCDFFRTQIFLDISITPITGPILFPFFNYLKNNNSHLQIWDLQYIRKKIHSLSKPQLYHCW